MVKEKATHKSVGRPRKYPNAAARVRAFRRRAAYPGHRYDVYLVEDAHIAIRVLMNRNKTLSASVVINAVILGTLKVPKTR